MVVHGSTTKPIAGTTQLSKARPSWLPKNQKARITTRGQTSDDARKNQPRAWDGAEERRTVPGSGPISMMPLLMGRACRRDAPASSSKPGDPVRLTGARTGNPAPAHAPAADPPPRVDGLPHRRRDDRGVHRPDDRRRARPRAAGARPRHRRDRRAVPDG